MPEARLQRTREAYGETAIEEMNRRIREVRDRMLANALCGDGGPLQPEPKGMAAFIQEGN